MKKNLLFLLSLFLCGVISKAQVGSALHFDGSNDNIRRAIVSSQNQQITMEARVIWDGVAPSARYIMYNGTNGTNGYGMFLASGSTSVAIKYGGSTYTSTYTLPTGSLTLLSCVIVGANGLLLYANGSLVWSTFPPPATIPTGSFSIGSDDAGASCFNGTIEEVRFWNRIVCAAEIAHRANCSPLGNEPQLVALYRFNQGVAAANNPTVTTLIDSSPSNYTATLNNFALTTGTTSNWYAPAGTYSSSCLYVPNTASISPSGTIALCAGNSATLSASPGPASYTWSNLSTGVSIAITPTATTNYSVLVNAGNCYSMANKIVTLNALPVVTVATTSTLLCIGQSATLNASGGSSYTWNPGGTGSVIVVSPTVNSTYTISVVDANTCTNTAFFTQSVTVCSGIANYTSDKIHFELSPNPSSNYVSINLSSLTGNYELEIRDLTGKSLMNEKITEINSKINISSLSEGIYFVSLKEEGKTLAVKKLIKE